MQKPLHYSTNPMDALYVYAAKHGSLFLRFLPAQKNKSLTLDVKNMLSLPVTLTCYSLSQ